jgi:P27 family predicted phage terminase small subunit
MGERGPLPKPAEVRIAEGNPSKRPIPKTPGIGRLFGPDIPEPPQHLGDVARSFWCEYAPMLVEAGLLRTGDLASLEALCQAYARARLAAALIEEEGPVAKGYRGQPVEHPAVKMERAAAQELREWVKHFGLSPAARTRLGGDGESGTTEPEDDLAELKYLGAVSGSG